MSKVLISTSLNPTQVQMRFSILKQQQFPQMGFVFLLLCAPLPSPPFLVQCLSRAVGTDRACRPSHDCIPGDALGQAKGASLSTMHRDSEGHRWLCDTSGTTVWLS